MFKGIMSAGVPFSNFLSPSDIPSIKIKDMVNYTKPLKIAYPAGMGDYVEINSSMRFDLLEDACYAVYNGWLLVFAGSVSGVLNPFTYYSTDGITWHSVRSGFTLRSGASCVVFNGYLYVFGGETTDGLSNDVWRTSDGITWENVVTANIFGVRKYFAVTVFNGSLFLTGGTGADAAELWKSSDGINWVRVVESASYGSLTKPAMIEYEGDLIVCGDNTVFSSPDGITFTELTDTFPVVSGHSLLIMYGKIYCFFGSDGSPTAGVYKSSDGENWYSVSVPAGVSARNECGAGVIGDSLFLFGGASDSWKRILPFNIIIDQTVVPEGEEVLLTDQCYYELFILGAVRDLVSRFCTLIGPFWDMLDSGDLVGDYTEKYVEGSVCLARVSDQSNEDFEFIVQSVSFESGNTIIVPVTPFPHTDFDFICLKSDQTALLADLRFKPVANYVDESIEKFMTKAALKPQGPVIEASGLIDVLSDRDMVITFTSGDIVNDKAVTYEPGVYKTKLVKGMKAGIYDENGVLIYNENITLN